jgi:phage-related protein (TIGR01555 family)
MYLGEVIDASRVMTIVNRKPYDVYQTAMLGRGISEFETLLEPLNQYANFCNMMYELISEAKVSVWKFDNYRDTMVSDSELGRNIVKTAIQQAESLKNSTNCVVIDKQDEFEQAQLNFGNIAEAWQFQKEHFAAATGKTIASIFGTGSSGFSSGEDDAKRDNAELERIREWAMPYCVHLYKIATMQLFDFIPDDITISFEPLKLINDIQQHEQKMQQGSLILSLATTITPDGTTIIDVNEAREALNANKILPIELSKRKIDKDLLTTGIPPVKQEPLENPVQVKKTPEANKSTYETTKATREGMFNKIRKK